MQCNTVHCGSLEQQTTVTVLVISSNDFILSICVRLCVCALCVRVRMFVKAADMGVCVYVCL